MINKTRDDFEKQVNEELKKQGYDFNGEEEIKRTKLQNRSLHKLLKIISDWLNDAKISMKKISEKNFFISWGKKSLYKITFEPLKKKFGLNNKETLIKLVEIIESRTGAEITKEFLKESEIKTSKIRNYYLKNLATELNEKGLEMSSFIKNMDLAFWSEEAVKDIIWRHFQSEHLGVEKSTAEITTKEMHQIFLDMNKFFSENFYKNFEWPSEESKYLNSL